ncbi:MAG: diaminohydroxyphosphoribosylaminopyrimidine deaminase [Halioglobus sp.]|jgi:diaminohydroxyphosphoribosylaminopyrimidine deaminase/5-amino-6-(5-phosphoribosylamino)uracil reductase
MNFSFDIAMMSRSLQLAALGQYSAMPNPHVGCILVRDGVVIGEGFTQPAGGNHAEIEALNQCGDARGATAYVTLEPCSHLGKTGPCADALIAAGVARVVIALEDPNPQVNGGGIKKLRAAGVEVSSGVLADEAAQVIPGFISRMSTGRPRIRAKLAMSVDGRTAMASGESQWITGPAARGDVQRLRAMSCAIVTGVGTVLSDDCSLTVRPEELGLDDEAAALAGQRQPLRAVLDSQLRTPAGAKILSLAAPTVLFHSNGCSIPESLDSCVERLHGLTSSARGLDLTEMVNELSRRQCNEILVESGPRLAGALLQAGLLDELIIYMAPLLLGHNARPLLELPLDLMSQKVQLEVQDVRKIGRDWRFTAHPV